MISKDYISRFEEALRAQNPFEELHKLAVSLRDAGMSQAELFSLFEEFQQRMGDDLRFDAIVDNMDFIWGGPYAKGYDLYPQMLSREIVDDYKKSSKGSLDLMNQILYQPIFGARCIST